MEKALCVHQLCLRLPTPPLFFTEMCSDPLQGEDTKRVLKDPVYKDLFSFPLSEACQPYPASPASPDSQYRWLLAPNPPLQPKSRKCSVGVPKGRSISQNRSGFTETLSFHIFVKFYLYIQCANELISRVSQEPVTHPPGRLASVHTLYSQFLTVCNEHLPIPQHQLFSTALCKHMYHF